MAGDGKAAAGWTSTASLATFPDSNSAVIWTSIYTGALPERHAQFDQGAKISL